MKKLILSVLTFIYLNANAQSGLIQPIHTEPGNGTTVFGTGVASTATISIPVITYLDTIPSVLLYIDTAKLFTDHYNAYSLMCMPGYTIIKVQYDQYEGLKFKTVSYLDKHKQPITRYIIYDAMAAKRKEL